MKAVRSGARSRWLLFRGPEYTVVRTENLFFNGLFGFFVPIGVLVGLVVYGLSIAEELDPRAPLWTLERSTKTTEKPGSRVRIGAMMLPNGDGLPPLCEVALMSGRGKGESVKWQGTVATNAIVRTDDGEELAIAVDQGTFLWQPSVLREVEDYNRTDLWKKRASLSASVDWHKEQCVAPGEQVFLDGCFVEPAVAGHRARIGACRTKPLVITPGDGTPTPRLEHLAQAATGYLGALGAALMFLVAYAGHVVRGSPLVQALERFVDPGAASRPAIRLRTILAIPGVWIAVLLVHWGMQALALPGYPQSTRAGYFEALAAACLGAWILVHLGARYARLRSALRSVEETPTRPLRGVESGTAAEVVVQVPPDAQAMPGPLSHLRHAYVGLSVTRVFREGKNFKAELESDVQKPSYLAVQDASGAAWLDLEHAVLDLRAFRHVIRKSSVLDDRAAMLLEGAAFKAFAAFELEERYIDHGETLYVLGVVTSRELGPAANGFRVQGGVPVLGGSAEHPAIVYAGTEKRLLSSLRRERLFLDVAFALMVLVTVGLLGVIGGAILAW